MQTGPGKFGVVGIVCFLLAACASRTDTLDPQSYADIPATWQQRSYAGDRDADWVRGFGDARLMALVDKATTDNHTLRQLAWAVDISEKRLRVTNSALWPVISADIRQSRSDSSASGTTAINTASAGLDLTWQIDLWGALSAADRQAGFQYLQAKATYVQARDQLVADVLSGWVNLIEAEKLLALFNERVRATIANDEIILSRYRKGLQSALDVYLVRNELNTELSRAAAQKTVVAAAKRQLERLAGDYPAGAITSDADLPNAPEITVTGLPQDLITRKPELVAQWNRLLSFDAAVAVAHARRLPSLSISAGINRAGGTIDDLASGVPTTWSLLGSVTAPLFNAGSLKAAADIAELELQQAEAAWLDALYGVYQNVENRMTEAENLADQITATDEAAKNAIIAADLSFEQYQKGLVTYTAVLDAQNSSFAAQASAIQLQAQALLNRIQLHLELGGNFGSEQTENPYGTREISRVIR